MAHLGIHHANTPWPFKNMEVGDVVVCIPPTDPTDRRQAGATAHAYGASTGKKFLTKQITNKATGEVGTKITRMPDDYVKPRASKQRAAAVRTQRGTVWPFEKLAPGESWSTQDPALMSRAMAAAGNRSTTATRQLRIGLIEGGMPPGQASLHKRVLYQVRTETDPATLSTVKVTVARRPDDVQVVRTHAAREKASMIAAGRAAAVEQAQEAPADAPRDSAFEFDFAPADPHLRELVEQALRSVRP